MPSLCAQDGTDVESFDFIVETTITSWGYFDVVIILQGLQGLHLVFHSPGCVWFTLPCVLFAVCIVCVCLFANAIDHSSSFCVGDSVQLHVHNLCQGDKAKHWLMCVLPSIPSGSSATHLRLVVYRVWLMHPSREILHSTNYGFYSNDFAGPKWFNNL